MTYSTLHRLDIETMKKSRYLVPAALVCAALWLSGCQTIRAHKSGSATTNDASEANGVVDAFNALGENQKQDLVNFLRSL